MNNHSQNIHRLLSTHKLLLIPTPTRNTFHLIGIFNLNMKSHTSVFGLISVAMIAFLFGTDEGMPVCV